MPWYPLLKAVHFMGLIALAGAFVIYPRAGVRLRAATTLHDVRSWLDMLELTRGMFHGGAAMMLLSGVAMAGIQWRAPHAFIAVGMVTLLLMWIGFALTASRHLRVIRKAVGNGAGPVPTGLAQTIRTPTPWIAMFAINLAALGVLFEMTLKLGWAGAIGLVLAFVAIGVVAGVLATRRRERPAEES